MHILCPIEFFYVLYKNRRVIIGEFPLNYFEVSFCACVDRMVGRIRKTQTVEKFHSVLYFGDLCPLLLRGF